MKTRGDIQPVIVVDTREQQPLAFATLSSVAGSLVSGDYAPRGLEHLCAIERKTPADLVASVTGERARFERELHRLRGMHFARVIVTGSRESIAAGDYRSRATPQSVVASCDAFEVRYRVPFVFVPGATEAAVLVERWISLFAREVVKTAQGLSLAQRKLPVRREPQPLETRQLSRYEPPPALGEPEGETLGPRPQNIS